MAGKGLTARPGRQWSRRFNHPYTARKTPPKPVIPILGTDQTAPWALFNASAGPLLGFRGYNPPAFSVPPAWPGGSVAIPPGVPASGQVVSFRPDITSVLNGSLDSALATFFASMPAGAFVSANHEAEIQNIGTQSQVIAMHTRIYGIFQANAPVACSYGQVVAVQSAFSGHNGFPLGPWMCTTANGGVNLDFYGMDNAPQSATITYADNIMTAINAMVGAGVNPAGPWSILEDAYHTNWHGSLAQWYSDGWAFAQAIGAVHYFPFFSPTIVNAFVLWPAPDPNVLRVLQDTAAVSRGDIRSPPAATIARSTQAALVSSSSSSGLTATFSSNPAAGSKVLAVVQSSGTTATYTVADNGTTPAAFTLDACSLANSSTIPSVFVYRADNITLPGAGTYAVSVTRSVAGPLQVAANAYTGVANGPPTSTSAVVGNSSNPAVNPVTPNDASSLFYSAFFCDSAASPETTVPASAEFTLQQVQQTPSGNAGPGAVADALVATPATRQGGFTLPDSPNWSMVMAAYGALPLNMQLVPGAEMTWACAMDNTPGITVNAGLASASGWAAVNQVAASASPNAGVAAATGAAVTPAASIAPAAATAGGTGTGLAPAVSLNATAGAAASTGGAVQPAVTVTVTAGLAAATGAALAPSVTASDNAAAGLAQSSAAAPFTAVGGTISLTLTALNPVGASGTSAAPVPSVAPTAGLATATGNGEAATVTTAGTTNAPAGLASATGAALNPAVTIAATAAPAAATGAAAAPAAAVSVNAGVAAAAGAGLNATVTTSGTTNANAAVAAATGTAQQPAVTVTPAAGAAAATGASVAPAASVAATTGLAAATGTALTPATAVTVTAGLATATGTALTATVVTGVTASPATAAGTATAQAATPAVTVTAGLPSATGAALAPTVATGVTPAAGLASATGAALAPAITASSNATATTAAATAAARAPAAQVAPAPAAAAGSVRGVAPTLVLVTLAQAAAAQALAAALAATGVGAADFTVGHLTASAAAGSTLTALTTPGVLVGAGAASGLTATDQRTGGPT